MSDITPDLQCLEWRMRTAEARRPTRVVLGLTLGTQGFKSKDRRDARATPGTCLLGEAAERIGTTCGPLKELAISTGQFEELVGIEDRFMAGVSSNRYAKVERAIAAMEAMLPTLRAAEAERRGGQSALVRGVRGDQERHRRSGWNADTPRSNRGALKGA